MNRPFLRLDTHERLIFALDVASYSDALVWIDRLGASVNFYKLGMELLAGGDYFKVIDLLAHRGKRIFVDLKFFDIPATVAAAVSRLDQWPITLCTLHAWHQEMLVHAAQAIQGQMRLLGVTVLTSMTQSDLLDLGLAQTPEDVVVTRALAAFQAGLDGVVASGQEVPAIRHATGEQFLIVCPGIRADNGSKNDQKRTMTASQAICNGADAVVVGRPIRLATDPVAAAVAISREIALSLQKNA